MRSHGEPWAALLDGWMDEALRSDSINARALADCYVSPPPPALRLTGRIAIGRPHWSALSSAFDSLLGRLHSSACRPRATGALSHIDDDDARPGGKGGGEREDQRPGTRQPHTLFVWFASTWAPVCLKPRVTLSLFACCSLLKPLRAITRPPTPSVSGRLGSPSTPCPISAWPNSC